MEIKILGTGCAGCRALYDTVREAVAEMGIDASVVKEENMMHILTYNVLQMPALVIDEQVVATGRKTLTEVKELLNKQL